LDRLCGSITAFVLWESKHSVPWLGGDDQNDAIDLAVKGQRHNGPSAFWPRSSRRARVSRIAKPNQRFGRLLDELRSLK
jgi:hypothetical protein